jgi:hypothetical protein
MLSSRLPSDCTPMHDSDKTSYMQKLYVQARASKNKQIRKRTIDNYYSIYSYLITATVTKKLYK